MKIKKCPECGGPLKKDTEADDDAEGGNYHSLVGHNYKCAKHGSVCIIPESERDY